MADHPNPAEERRWAWIWMGGRLVGADPTVRAPREQEELVPADRERKLVEALERIASAELWHDSENPNDTPQEIARAALADEMEEG